jgi:hypothetical protein
MVGVVGPTRYSRPSSDVKSICPRMASARLCWPPTMFSHVGDVASSRSASQTRAPELSALMVILRSVGPVISTRRSSRPGPGPATRHVRSSRMCRVSGRKSGSSPFANRSLRRWRASSRSWRGPANRVCRSATNARASGLRICSEPGTTGPVISRVGAATAAVERVVVGVSVGMACSSRGAAGAAGCGAGRGASRGSRTSYMSVLVRELRGLGRPREREGRAGRVERGGDQIEVARAHLALVTRRGVAVGL